MYLGGQIKSGKYDGRVDMGEVDAKNYQGKDRRTNGARLKLAMRDWITISSLCVTLILFGGNIKWTVNNHSEVIAEQKAQININTQKIVKTENEITNIKENLIYIRGKIDTLVLRVK